MAEYLIYENSQSRKGKAADPDRLEEDLMGMNQEGRENPMAQDN